MRAILSLVFIVTLLTGSLARADSIYARARDIDNRISFQNSGGFENGGVCWWHSRLQRAFLYLARYNPNAPKPTDEKVHQLLHDLIWERGFIEIPGYANTREFTEAYKGLIQEQLNAWQVTDGIFNLGFIQGLEGSSSLQPETMKTHMDDIYTQYRSALINGDLLWLMLQIKGVSSHASLLETMTPDGHGGYFMQMIDSNFPTILINYNYHVGDRALTPEKAGYTEDSWVPYIGYGRDLTRIHNAVRAGTVIQ
jgi:hypothetical protein